MSLLRKQCYFRIDLFFLWKENVAKSKGRKSKGEIYLICPHCHEELQFVFKSRDEGNRDTSYFACGCVEEGDREPVSWKYFENLDMWQYWKYEIEWVSDEPKEGKEKVLFT